MGKPRFHSCLWAPTRHAAACRRVLLPAPARSAVAEAVLPGLSHAALGHAMSALASGRPALYARHRELLTLLGHAHQAWALTRVGLAAQPPKHSLSGSLFLFLLLLRCLFM